MTNPLSTQFVSALLREIRDCSLDFAYYYCDRFILLEQTNRLSTRNYRAKDQLSYREWIERKDAYRAIKIEGLELNAPIMRVLAHYMQRKHKIADVHAFVSNTTGVSFKWHTDTVSVVLLVLTGCKYVSINGSITTLYPGQSVFIPAGTMHRVLSKKGTVALSIGIK